MLTPSPRSSESNDSPDRYLWVVSYADMVTLLFALFVVLYSFGEVKLSKLRQLRQSLSLAFRQERSGAPIDGAGGFDSLGFEQRISGVALLREQPISGRELLLRTLPDRFEAVTGQPLTVELTQGEVVLRAPLSACFAPRETQLRADVQAVVSEVFAASLEFTSQCAVRIVAPNVVVQRAENGTLQRSGGLCMLRLDEFLQFAPMIPRVLLENITTEFRYLFDSSEDWEDVGTIEFAFSVR